MTAPREIIPGRIYFISRRTTQRQFLLCPHHTVTEIFEYCLAEAAEKFSIGLIAWCAMSNHYHSVVHDPLGKLPEFLERFHKMVAKAMNAHLGRWENFWSSTETSVLYLPTLDGVLEKVCYVLSNPMGADLVDRVGDWPGSSSLGLMTGRSKRVSRPKVFFSKTGEMPESVTLSTVQPPLSATAGETRSKWAARVQAAVEASEQSARTTRELEGRRVMGRKAVLRMSAFDAPSTPAPRRKLRPAVACRDKLRLIAELEALAEFRRRHAEARRRFSQGELSVVFPAGTYRMRRLGAQCAPYPAMTA